jgi:EpsI family protein
MRTRSLTVQFVVTAVLLAATMGYLHARSKTEHIPTPPQLAGLPKVINGREGRDLKLTPGVLEVLGPGNFLSRAYVKKDAPMLDLFIAFFPSQKTGDTIHSPKNCLPGSGWFPIESSDIAIDVAGRAPINANRYIIAKGADRQLVVYWYQAHGRTVQSEYWAKFYLVADAMRMNRTDGAMVRIVTPVASNGGVTAAEERALQFARELVPMLDTYIPI